MRNGFTYNNVMEDLSIDQVMLYSQGIAKLRLLDDKGFVYNTLIGSRGDDEAVDKFFKQEVK
jgi:hypothetical protein